MISDGAYFRIHMHPKRFPVASALREVGWSSRVVHHGGEFVIANKPPGIQASLIVSEDTKLDTGCIRKARPLALLLFGPMMDLWVTNSNPAIKDVHVPQVPSTVDNVRESLVAKIEEVSEDESNVKFETLPDTNL